MARIAVRGEDGDLVAERLQPDGGIDDEAFSAANAKVGVEEDDVLLRRHLLRAFSAITPSPNEYTLNYKPISNCHKLAGLLPYEDVAPRVARWLVRLAEWVAAISQAFSERR